MVDRRAHDEREAGRTRSPRRRDRVELGEDRGDRDQVAPDGLLGIQQLAGNSAVEALLSHTGEPVPSDVRGPMEASLAHGLAEVRVHRGRPVDEVAEGLDAAAFTAGSEVYLHSDVPGPDQQAGRLVLAEELAHVVQGVGTGSVERITRPGERVEAEAADAARAAVTGVRADLSPQPLAATAVARWFKVGKWLTEEEKEELGEGGDIWRGADDDEYEEEGFALPEEKRRMLASGAIPKLEGASSLLESGSRRDLERARSLVSPLPTFIEGFGPEMEFDPLRLVGVWGAVQAGVNALDGVLNPAGMLQTVRAKLATAAANARVLGREARDPQTDEEGQPLPRTALTPAEARHLLAGVAEPAMLARSALGGSSPDYELARMHLEGTARLAAQFVDVPGIPAGVIGRIVEIAGNLDLVVNQIEALEQPPEEAVQMARDHFEGALDQLRELTAEPEDEAETLTPPFLDQIDPARGADPSVAQGLGMSVKTP